MPEGISICIPTCDRPALIPLAIASCLEQRHRPLEILIGDDSRDDATEAAIAGLEPGDGVAIRYRRNPARLGQAANVNALFDRATCDRLVLLHDDDVLSPTGLDRLVAAWAAAPGTICAYGRQEIVDAGGAPLPRETLSWNERYFRRAGLAGPQARPLVAALRQQVPNDGFLIDTALARAVRLRPESLIGQCVDADFMIRVGERAPSSGFLFIDDIVSRYRLTPCSIARSATLNHREDLLFDAVRAIVGDAEVEAAKTVILSRISEGAALDAAMAGRRGAAFAILRSDYYRTRLFSRWTAYRVACALSPRLGGLIKRLVDPLFSPSLPPHDRRGHAA